MPTSSGSLAAGLLDALGSVEVPFAVMHQEAEIAAGSVTADLDCAVGRDVASVTRDLAEASAPWGLRPVMAWPYDVSGLSSFWCTSTGREGVQLDLTCDERGTSRYGFRTPRLLERSRPGTRWPVLSDLDEGLYLLRKSQVKADADRLERSQSRIREEFGLEVAQRRAREVFSRPAAMRVASSLRNGRHGSRRAGAAHSLRSLRRVGSRLVRPAGFWAELVGDDPGCELARAVAARFDRFLVGADALDLDVDTSHARSRWLRQVATRKWRPRLLIATAHVPSWPRPDASIAFHQPELDLVCELLVAAMEERCVQGLAAMAGSGSRDRVGKTSGVVPR